MENFLHSIVQMIQQFGPKGVFLAGIIEQIVVPIPSPIVPMGGGFFLIPKNIPFLAALKSTLFKVAFPFSLGSTLGSTLVFLIAYKGLSALINKYEKFFGFGWEEVEKMKKKFFHGKPTDELLIYLLMTIPVVPSVLVSATCGALKINPLNFYFFTFLGLASRGIILGLLGWWVGEAYLQIASGVNKLENLVLIGVGAIVALLLLFGYLKREKILGK